MGWPLIDAQILRVLNGKEKDKNLVLAAENQILKFLFNIEQNEASSYDDEVRCTHAEGSLIFEDVNSYHRLLLHRIARYYKINHFSYPNAKAIILTIESAAHIGFQPSEENGLMADGAAIITVRKEEKAQYYSELVDNSSNNFDQPRKLNSIDLNLPLLLLSDLVEPAPPPPKFKILRRKPKEEDSEAHTSTVSTIISVEERQRQYMAARARIFMETEASELEPKFDGYVTDTRICWKDLDMIAPFIPLDNTSSETDNTLRNSEFAEELLESEAEDKYLLFDHPEPLKTTKTLKHIYCVREPLDPTVLNELGSKFKCKVITADDLSDVLLIIKEHPIPTTEEIVSICKCDCSPWRPEFYPEADSDLDFESNKD